MVRARKKKKGARKRRGVSTRKKSKLGRARRRRSYSKARKRRALFDARQAKAAGLTLREYAKRRAAADRRHRKMVAEIPQEAMVEMLMGKRPMSPKLGAYLRGHVDLDPSMVGYTTKKGYGF